MTLQEVRVFLVMRTDCLQALGHLGLFGTVTENVICAWGANGESPCSVRYSLFVGVLVGVFVCLFDSMTFPTRELGKAPTRGSKHQTCNSQSLSYKQ